MAELADATDLGSVVRPSRVVISLVYERSLANKNGHFQHSYRQRGANGCSQSSLGTEPASASRACAWKESGSADRRCDLRLSRFCPYYGNEVDGKSVMGLILLAAGRGARLRIRVEGTDANEAMPELEQLPESDFDEK